MEEDFSGKDFPLETLNSLDEQLNRPKWVVPVRPGDELEKLIKFSIVMCREGVLRSPPPTHTHTKAGEGDVCRVGRVCVIQEINTYLYAMLYM